MTWLREESVKRWRINLHSEEVKKKFEAEKNKKTQTEIEPDDEMIDDIKEY